MCEDAQCCVTMGLLVTQRVSMLPRMIHRLQSSHAAFAGVLMDMCDPLEDPQAL